MRWKLIVVKSTFEYDENIEVEAIGRAEQILRRIGVIFLGRMKGKLSIPGSGKTYPSKARGSATHQASAPGEPPAPDLGAYRASWQFQVEKIAQGFQLLIGTQFWSVFGRRLELGGSNGGPRPAYIAPRPHVRATWDETKDEVDRLLEQ